MNAFLQSMVALMMAFAGQTHFTATTPGQYYEPVAAKCDVADHKTYAIYVRYFVWGQKYGEYGAYNTQVQHLQVRNYPGCVTVQDLINDGKGRADPGIDVVSTL